jgi:tetratricopeptide (TPR) repeat protein
MVGLLFLVHPENSTVVNYISSRADSQAALFILLSLYLFVRYASLSHSGIIYLAGSLMSFILALLSKELAIILPFLLLATIPFISNGKKDILKKTTPFFIVLGIYALLRLTLLNFPSAGSGMAPSLCIRLLTTAESFTRLIGLLFIPLKIHIEKSIPYSSGLVQATTLSSLAILSAVGIFALWVRRYSKVCFFGLIWFFISLMPMANIVPINATMADHWLYLPCIGLFLSVIGGSADFIERFNVRRRGLFRASALCLYVLIVIIFSSLTIKQNGIWRDPLTFYRLALEYSPNSYRAHNEIGIIYLHQDRFDMAIPEFKEAVSLNPQFDQAYDNLGVAYDKKGEPKKAIAQYKKALKIKPGNPKIYNNLGNAYNKMNRFDEAIGAYQKALRLAPDFRAVYNNLGVVYYKKGMYKETEKYWNKALELDPNDKSVRDNIRVLEGTKKKGP